MDKVDWDAVRVSRFLLYNPLAVPLSCPQICLEVRGARCGHTTSFQRRRRRGWLVTGSVHRVLTVVQVRPVVWSLVAPWPHRPVDHRPLISSLIVPSPQCLRPVDPSSVMVSPHCPIVPSLLHVIAPLSHRPVSRSSHRLIVPNPHCLLVHLFPSPPCPVAPLTRHPGALSSGLLVIPGAVTPSPQ